MATLDIETRDYWFGSGIDIRLNPAANLDPAGLESAIRDQGIDAAVVLATSGSQGQPKYVVLEKSAILHSAQTVNDYCGISQKDCWLGGLSTFHIGGLAIYARALLSGSKVLSMNWSSWTRDGSAFIEAARNATLTSLTPVHLFDLVSHQVVCPQSLRGVFIGGGKLEQDLAKKAVDLGYPLWTTFGMTETASQIATSLNGELTSLPILPHWQTKVNESGTLLVKGDALLRGYFTQANSQWQWHSAVDKDGYFQTGDLVSITNNRLTPLGRSDQQIKVLGELVSLTELEAFLTEQTGCQCVVWAVPEARRGFDLFACVETPQDKSVELEQINRQLPPFKALKQIFHSKKFPRTEVGKIDKKKVIGEF